MTLVPAQEIKRRGIKAVDEGVRRGPVCIVRNNKPTYIVLTESDYAQMMNDLAEARLALSDADLKAGRVSQGTASELMREIRRGK